MKTLRNSFEEIKDVLAILGITFPIIVAIWLPGGTLRNNQMKYHCYETIKTHYQTQNSEQFCQDPCIAECLYRVIDIYDGKIDLNNVYETARERCERR